MTDDADVLAQIKTEAEAIRKIMGDVPGSYQTGKSIMVESMDVLDRNPKKALKIMRKARDSVKEESVLTRRYNSLKQKWGAIPSYQMDEAEMASERHLLELLRAGSFEEAGPVLKVLEDSMHLDLVENVDSSLLLDLPDAEIVLGRGSTLEASAANQSAFPLRIITLTGRSVQAQVIVLEDYKGVIQPQAERKIHINVIPGAEGDVVVELEALVEVNSKRVTFRKHGSMTVVQPKFVEMAPRIAPAVRHQVNGTNVSMPGSQAQYVHDPMELVKDGTADQWVDLINMFFENKGAVNLETIAQAFPEFQKMDGYMNLFQAIMVIDYRSTPQWSAWFETKGFAGNELTKRCTSLLFDMRTAPDMKLELELDGSVGSSNNDHLIGALNIASGNIHLPREKLKGIRSWDIKGKFRGEVFTLRVDRNVIKGTDGAKSKAYFSLQTV